ncbi:efflux RND transporter permease subunit [Paenibacillus sp. HB172176]|uniref:efflux RND transporter permease subunit n=1 Tax=Paenibacillus sp. HB172176 TaxID=2493690 RepID=UPI00143A974B|nr:efflux RND transporter permease subunit [Paenibacillus sp. HB172176]
MNRLTEWAFRNKSAVGLLVVMALVMGIISYLRLPMEFLPEADNPQVMVTAIGQGNNAKSMEEQVTSPLEDALAFVKGKTSMLSSSGDGYSQVTLNFDSNTNMKDAKAEVQSAVDAVSLPASVMKPFVVQFNTSMIPISWVSITFEDSMSEQQREAALEEWTKELKKLDGVGQMSVSGKSNAVIRITPNAEKLAEAGVPAQALMGVLQGRGVNASLGEQIVDGQAANLNVTGAISDLETLKSLPIAPGVKLSDVATVETDINQESISRMNGKDAIMITISKAANANAVTVGNEVEDRMNELNGEIAGTEGSLLLSTAESVVHSVNSMLQEVLLGALFATIVILLFMRNVKATIVTIVSIPLSLGITLYLLDLSGVTLNVITLGGVAVAVGRLVDDSIVVIENIYRRLQKERFSIKLIAEATKEVASAITASTIVTVAVFLPMGLLRGSLQAFLLPFALTVTYSLLASLVVALTVVPLLSAVLLRGTSEKEHKGSSKFAAFLAWNLRRKWLALSLAFILLVVSVGAYVNMPKGALDSSSAENVNISLKYPSDTPAETVQNAGKQLEQTILGMNEISWVMMSIGNSSDAAQYGSVTSPTEITYLVDLKKGTDAEVFIDNVTSHAGEYEGAELISNAADLMMGGGGTTVFVDVSGDDPAQMAEAAEKLKEAMASVDGVLKVETNQEEVKPVYSFEINPEAAKGQDVSAQLQSLINPMPIGSIKLSGSDTPVILMPSAHPKSESDLNALMIMTEEGAKPVSSVAKLVRTEEASLYYHKEGKPYIRVTASADPKLLSKVGDDINKKVADLDTEDGITLAVGGASAEQAGDFADLGITALISIGLVYLIMVLTFKTLRAPIAIMISLPLATIGAVTGLMVSGVTPDFTAMFGALMLIGIVVTNAIVLIDRVKKNEETMTIREALIEAATTRMRPIIMTAVATISAMLPLVFGSHESGSIVSQSLAIVVIGGLAVATLLTLIIVPCLYELLFFLKSRRQRAAAKIASPQEPSVHA